MVRAKICGITTYADAMRCAEFGADAIGLNFYRKSPRFVEASDAVNITAGLPENVYKVGVFVNETAANILAISSEVRLNAIQLHGDESPEFADEVESRGEAEVIRVLRLSRDVNTVQIPVPPRGTVLIDAFRKTSFGGTGETLDWGAAAEIRLRVSRLYLAGGLTAENVAEAIRIVGPFAVDACSLLEKRPGVKDLVKLRRFIEEAKKS
jgi:phosphoribosylanthranilate isomerase